MLMKKNKILFINPITIRPVVGPIGLDYMADILKKNGFHIDFIDNSFSKNIRNEIKNYLRDNRKYLVSLKMNKRFQLLGENIEKYNFENALYELEKLIIDISGEKED